jgi:phosphinothricin acetyltransferase
MSHRPTIRLATSDDAAAIASIYAPFCEASAVSFEDRAPTPEEMADRIRSLGGTRPWIVLEDESIAGYAYASAHHERAAYRWSVSTTVYVGAAYRRRGVGRALYATLFDLLRTLGYYSATAGITLPNPASVRLHEAFGFELVGVYRQIGFKQGEWHDVAWYEAPLQPVTPNPPNPTSIDAVSRAAMEQAVEKGLGALRL